VTLVLTVLAGALLAGFVSGLAGFGTGLVALGLWLHVIDPLLAAPLVVICSVPAQLLSLLTLRHAFNWPRIWPFLLGGLIGVPLGTFALEHIEASAFRAALGAFLVLYATVMLAARRLPVIRWGGRPADGAVGFGGGILGGAAGLSGPLPTIWCSLKGWSKDEQRAVFQPFNLAVLSWALVSYGLQGVLSAEVGRIGLTALPGTLIGVWIGIKAYGRVDERQFRLIVLWLLLASGATLTLANLI
jgi:uncharacterized membrane protein YfcA